MTQDDKTRANRRCLERSQKLLTALLRISREWPAPPRPVLRQRLLPKLVKLPSGHIFFELLIPLVFESLLDSLSKPGKSSCGKFAIASSISPESWFDAVQHRH